MRQDQDVAWQIRVDLEPVLDVGVAAEPGGNPGPLVEKAAIHHGHPPVQHRRFFLERLHGAVPGKNKVRPG